MIFLGIFYFFAIGVFWASWTCGLVLTSIWGNSQSLFLQTLLLLLSLLSFWYFYYAYVIYFDVSHGSWIFYFFFQSFFSLLFSFGIFVVIFSSSEILFSFMPNLLTSPSETFFIYVIAFLISNISFWFLRISIFPHLLSISSCILSTFSIKDLSIVIIVF